MWAQRGAAEKGDLDVLGEAVRVQEPSLTVTVHGSKTDDFQAFCGATEV
jgi:hypothetical protein